MTKAKLKTKVFDSAWKIVEKEGIGRLNVRNIAKLSDCSLGSIYNCFENFESLQLHINAAVLLELFSSLRKVIDQGIAQKKKLPEIFRELGNAYIEFGNKNKYLWKALFEHVPEEPLPEWYRAQAQEGIYQIANLLSKHFNIAEKEMKSKVGFFWASIHGMGAILLNRKMEMVSDLFKENNLDSYIEYCLQGLFPPT
jgi:AcrR family transcriptional regulator